MPEKRDNAEMPASPEPALEDSSEEAPEAPGPAAPAAPADPVAEARRILAAADPEETHKSMLALSRPTHAEVLQALEYNEAFDFHNPSCVRIEPSPHGLDTVDLYATAAYPSFQDMLVAAFTNETNHHLLNHLRTHIFDEGHNVALVTNHGQIIDIALVCGALLFGMCDEDRTFGATEETVAFDDLVERLNVLVSRMVATQQAFGVPALQVLQCGARTFLSIPQTASRRRARLDPAIVKANNVVARHELGLQLSKGGQILAMAASGSQDLSLAGGLLQRARKAWKKRRSDEPPETPTLHLQPLYDGTVALMRDCRYVLPVAVSMDATAPACELGEMTVVRTPEDCHRVMDWIATAHEEATGVHTIYHWHEDDLLTQVRSIGDPRKR